MTVMTRLPDTLPTRGRRPGGPDLRGVVLAIQFWVLGLLPFLSAITTARYFADDGSTSSPALVPALQGAVSALQGRGLFALAVLGFLVVLPRLRTDERTSKLAIGFCGLAFASVLSAFLGTVPSPATVPLTLLIIGATWYFAPPVGLDWLVRQVRLLLRFYVVGSLVAAVALSSWALEPDYANSVIPGVAFRLHGLAAHANYLAPLLLFGLIVERLAPRAGLGSRLWTLAACVALVLTQSRTTLLAVVAILVVEGFRRSRSLPRRRRLQADVLAIAGTALFAVLCWRLNPFAASTDVAPLDTVQARVEVWAVTLQSWWENPVFGYGLTLWGADMRAEYVSALGWTVPHAHNQLVQTLGEAGIVGALALVFYVVQLARSGWAHAEATGGVSLAIVVFVLIECLTESPLARAGADIFLPFAVFVVFLTIARSAAPVPAHPTEGAA